MLQHDAGWVAVLDGDRYLGVLTPASLHEALRRSVESDLTGVEPDSVDLETVRRHDGRRHARRGSPPGVAGFVARAGR